MINAAVLGTGKQIIDIGANLTTSRMVTYGGLTELQDKGYRTFQLQAVLDSKTSKLCRRLHGRVFKVDVALSALIPILHTTDPDDLKSMAPFPKQNKDSLAQIERMSNKELQDIGIFIPPFHPSCRTIVVKTGEVRVAEPVYTPIEREPQQQLDTSPIVVLPDFSNSDIFLNKVPAIKALVSLSPKVPSDLKDSFISALESARNLGDLPDEFQELFIEFDSKLRS